MSDAIVLKVDARQLAQFVADLKSADRAFPNEFKKGARAATKTVVAQLKSNAPSARISGSIKQRASYSGTSAKISVLATAADAAPLNNKDHGGTFRHPVYGNRQNWVAQTARPWWGRTIQSNQTPWENAMLQVIDRVGQKAGFH